MLARGLGVRGLGCLAFPGSGGGVMTVEYTPRPRVAHWWLLPEVV